MSELRTSADVLAKLNERQQPAEHVHHFPMNQAFKCHGVDKIVKMVSNEEGGGYKIEDGVSETEEPGVEPAGRENVSSSDGEVIPDRPAAMTLEERIEQSPTRPMPSAMPAPEPAPEPEPAV